MTLAVEQLNINKITTPVQMEKQKNTILDVQNVNAFYGDFQALYDIDMSFVENKVTALIGPSGCGKSTFLRSINRMNDEVAGFRLEGNILYKGDNLAQEKIDLFNIRKQIGMVFQKPNPFAKSIYENIAFGPRKHGVRKKAELNEIVESSLKKAALWDEVKDRLGHSALSLSGGQQQRLCVARAIAMQPKILLLDEPASALDPISTHKIEGLISELKESYTVIIVTHNMQQAARISDYTAFFYMGRKVEFNETTKIFTKPDHKQTEDYVSGQFG